MSTNETGGNEAGNKSFDESKDENAEHSLMDEIESHVVNVENSVTQVKSGATQATFTPEQLQL